MEAGGIPEQGTNKYAKKYDWNLMTNGTEWLAIRGEDYTCEDHSFAAYLRMKAPKVGMKVTISNREPGRVRFRFYPREDAT